MSESEVGETLRMLERPTEAKHDLQIMDFVRDDYEECKEGEKWIYSHLHNLLHLS